MTDFNELAGLQAQHTLTLLGGAVGTYTPPNGEPLPCTILIESDVLTGSANGQTSELNTVATVDKNEVLHLEKNGLLAVPGAQYTIARIESDDGFHVQAIVR